MQMCGIKRHDSIWYASKKIFLVVLEPLCQRLSLLELVSDSISSYNFMSLKGACKDINTGDVTTDSLGMIY